MIAQLHKMLVNSHNQQLNQTIYQLKEILNKRVIKNTFYRQSCKHT